MTGALEFGTLHAMPRMAPGGRRNILGRLERRERRVSAHMCALAWPAQLRRGRADDGRVHHARCEKTARGLTMHTTDAQVSCVSVQTSHAPRLIQ